MPAEIVTVRQMVAEYLKDNGYDGLAGEECGCWLNDLMPCEYFDAYHCVAGHEGPPPENEGEGVDTWMYAGKRPDAPKEAEPTKVVRFGPNSATPGYKKGVDGG